MNARRKASWSERKHWQPAVMLLLASWLVAGIIVVSAPQAEAVSPVRLTFEKELAPCRRPGPIACWEGTVDGDTTGDLTTEWLDARQSGVILHVMFDWIVDADNPAFSFTARLEGILNLSTGGVVMNGRVIEGYLVGARVHEEGQLVDPDPAVLGFEGSIRIMPATAH